MPLLELIQLCDKFLWNEKISDFAILFLFSFSDKSNVPCGVSDRFLAVYGEKESNNDNRDNVDDSSSEHTYLFRVDVGLSLQSDMNIPIEIEIFEEQINDIKKIPGQWRLFSASFPQLVETDGEEGDKDEDKLMSVTAIIMSARVADQSSLILLNSSGQ